MPCVRCCFLGYSFVISGAPIVCEFYIESMVLCLIFCFVLFLPFFPGLEEKCTRQPSYTVKVIEDIARECGSLSSLPMCLVIRVPSPRLSLVGRYVRSLLSSTALTNVGTVCNHVRSGVCFL